MDRGIRKVRQSIKRRKKIRDKKELQTKRTLPLIASDEEKYGFERPLYDFDVPVDKKREKTLVRSSTLLKAIISVVLFFGTALLLQSNIPALQQPKQFTYQALQKEFPFAQVNEWYVTTFGTPLSITPRRSMNVGQMEQEMMFPVVGDVVETFATNGSGIMISPMENSPVSAMDGGVVIFAGNMNDTNKTVIIQHADGSETTYGFLHSIDVHLYQIVYANETIATFQPKEHNEHVYFSIEKDNQYVDPAKVIPVDDIP